MRIKVIMTDTDTTQKEMRQREKMLSKAVSSDCSITVCCIKTGPTELDCDTDEAFASAEMVKEAIAAEKEGYDALVTYGFADVAIEAMRENVGIPVIGPGETAVAVAGLLCNRFGVITTEQRNVARTYRRLMKYPTAAAKLTSVRPVNVYIGNMRDDPRKTHEMLLAICEDFVWEERVEGVILGCLSMVGYGKEIEEKLGIKVFEPAYIGVAYAEMCVRVGIVHTQANYPRFDNVSGVLSL